MIDTSIFGTEVNENVKLKVGQISQTLAVSDGGPAKNAADLDFALQSHTEIDSVLYWVAGSVEDTVFSRGVSPTSSIRPQKIVSSRWSNSNFLGRAATRFQVVRRLFTVIRTNDIVIFHGYFLWWIIPSSLICIFMKRPFVIIPHGSLTRRQQGFSRTRKKLFELLAGWFIRSNCTAFVVYSNSESDDLRNLFPKSKLQASSIGVNLPENYSIGESSHSPLRLLTMSRIAEKKRIDLVIGAIRVLKEYGIDAELIVAGDGGDHLKSELLSLTESLELGDRVQFVGEIVGKEKEDAFLWADYFLLPSEDENFGIGLAEAASYGLPMIVSDRVGSAESMPSLAGSLVSELTPEAVAKGIVAAEGTDYSQSATAARKFAQEQFDWKIISKNWEIFLRSSLNSSRAAVNIK